MTIDTNKPVYTHLQAEAMLCVWEHMTELHDTDDVVHAIWGRVGAVQMRQYGMAIGTWVEQVYEGIRVEAETSDHWGGLAYDWEIVPVIFSYVTWLDAAPVIPPLAEIKEKLLAELEKINA